MSWRDGDDDPGRHRGNMVQARILEQRVREGGGYEVRVEMPGGYILDKIPVAAGNKFVGGGPTNTAWLSVRNGDKNHFEAHFLSSDPAQEHTPTKPTGFIQNPSNKKQYLSIDGDLVKLQTDGKDTVINDKYTVTADGIIKGPNGVSFNLETGEVKGSALSINLNTGAITGDISLNGNLVASGNVSDGVNTP